MAMRKGLGKGKGKGYHNIINKDKKVHSDSAKGKKQPQDLKNVPKPFFNKFKDNVVPLKNIKTKENLSFWLYYGLRGFYFDEATISSNRKLGVKVNYSNNEDLNNKLSYYNQIIDYYEKHPMVDEIEVEKKPLKRKRKFWTGAIRSGDISQTKDVYMNTIKLKINVKYK